MAAWLEALGRERICRGDAWKEAMSASPLSEALLAAARADLVLRVGGTDKNDLTLFEHACRVERYAAHIGRWIAGQGQTRLDAEELSAAAMYHGAAWAIRYHDGQIERSEVLAKPMSDVHLELSASKAAESLRSLYKPNRLEGVCQIIRECGRRDTTYIPAQIVSESANLDQIGPLALWQMIQRNIEEGRGVEAALQTWDRQREYNFWHARIKDAFRFPVVKRLAEQRLADLDRFMAALRAHSTAEDLADGLAGSQTPAKSSHPSKQQGQNR